MRYFYSLLVIIFTLFFVPGCRNIENEQMVDVFFENGLIYTMDNYGTVSENMAIKDGKIVFLGTADDGKNYKVNAKEVVDLDKKIILPGFIDPWIKVMHKCFFDFCIEGIKDIDSLTNIVKTEIENSIDKDVYVGLWIDPSTLFSVNCQMCLNNMKRILDGISSEKAIVIFSMDGKFAWLNSKAFEYFNINSQTIVPWGGEICLNNKTRECSGMIYANALDVVSINNTREDRTISGFLDLQNKLNSFGYTSIMILPDRGFSNLSFDLLKKMEDSGKLNIRVRSGNVVKNSDLDIERLVENSDKYNSDMFKVDSGKICINNIFDERGKLPFVGPFIEKSYADKLSYWENQEELNKIYIKINSKKKRIYADYCNLSATRISLSACEYAKNNLPNDFRNIIYNFNGLNENDIILFNEYGIIPVVSIVSNNANIGNLQNRNHFSVNEQFKSIFMSDLDSNSKIAISLNFPSNVILNPFEQIQMFVNEVPVNTKSDSAKMKKLLQNIIRGYTCNAAYSMNMDDITGSLEVGKFADFMVLNQDIFENNYKNISKTKVLTTYLSGNVVNKNK